MRAPSPGVPLSGLDADQKLAPLTGHGRECRLSRPVILEIHLRVADPKMAKGDTPQPVGQVRMPDVEPVIEAVQVQPQHGCEHVGNGARLPMLADYTQPDTSPAWSRSRGHGQRRPPVDRKCSNLEAASMMAVKT